MFKTLITKTFSLLSLCIATTAFNPTHADSPLEFDLLSHPNQVVTLQTGHFNHIDIEHTGSELLSSVEQSGANNYVKLQNSGSQSVTHITQIGDDNRATFDLNRSSQKINVIQRGNDMQFKVYQN